jgi:hypothetical protein
MEEVFLPSNHQTSIINHRNELNNTTTTTQSTGNSTSDINRIKFDDDFILNEDFTNTNILLNNDKLNLTGTHARVPITSSKPTTSKRN